MSTKQETQHYILFDIDSSSIGVLVFEQSDVKGKKIYKEIFTDRKNITGGADTEKERFFLKTKKTFHDLAEKAHKYSGNSITEIFVNVSSPWASSQKRVLHFEKKDEFVVTKDLLKKITEKELGQKSTQTRDFRDHNELVLLDREELDIYANGYKTKNIFGKKVKDLDVHSLVSYISPEVKDEFNHIIEKHFHAQATFLSNFFVEYKAMQALFPHEDNVSHFDLSGEMTELSLIINDELSALATLPIGTNTIVRELARVLRIPFVKAKSLISMYQEENLDEKYKKDIEKAMNHAFLFWFKSVYNLLDEVSKKHLVPNTFSLLADSHIENWLKEFLLKNEELKHLIHNDKQMSILDPKFAFDENNHKEIEHISDSSLAYILYFLEGKLESK